MRQTTQSQPVPYMPYYQERCDSLIPPYWRLTFRLVDQVCFLLDSVDFRLVGLALAWKSFLRLCDDVFMVEELTTKKRGTPLQCNPFYVLVTLIKDWYYRPSPSLYLARTSAKSTIKAFTCAANEATASRISS